MSKLAFLVPVGMFAAGIYLFALAMAPGGTVQIIAGHEIPQGMAMMFGAVMIFGSITVGIELFRRARTEVSSRSARRG